MPRAVFVLLVVSTVGLANGDAGRGVALNEVVLCRPAVQLVPTPSRPGAFLEGIAVSPGGAVWAVGSTDDSALGSVVLRWNGKRFSRTQTPSGTGGLRDVVAPSMNEAWAVGIDGVLHWDGRRWVRTAAPSGSLWGISAASPDDIWAVGTSSSPMGLLVIHWDGRSWKRVPFLPIPAQHTDTSPGVILTGFAFLEDVLALARNDVWVVGSGTGGPITAHWDGHRWYAYPVANARQDDGFGSLAAVSRNHVWAAGGSRGGGIIAEWNGQKWNIKGRSSWIANVTVRQTEIWAIWDDAIARWNGSKWVSLEKQHPDIDLHGLTVDSNGDVWAAGWRLAPGEGSIVYRYHCST